MDRVQVPRRSDIALVLLVVGCALFAFWDALTAMVHQWGANAVYSYGYAVPFVSLFLLWSRRRALARLTPQPAHLSGALVLMLSAALAILGRIGGMQVLEQIAFLVSLAGGVMLVLGVSYVRAAWASLLYLLLMVPFWEIFTEPMHWPFQQWSAAFGVKLLQAGGIPVYQENTIIALPQVTLEVARACSGVNYLIAVVALGLPMSYVYLNGLWRRVTLLAISVAIAALANGLRVGMIGWLAYLEIGSPIHGPYHVLHGLFVSAIGYVAIFLGLRALSRDSAASTDLQTTDAISVAGPPMLPRMAAICLTLVFVTIGVTVRAYELRPVPLTSDLWRVTDTVSQWRAESVLLPPDAVVEPWIRIADDHVRRRFVAPSGEQVDVFVGYFMSQRQGKEAVNVRAASLHRAAKLRRIERSAGVLEVNVIPQEGTQPAALFWYEMPGGTETSQYWGRARSAWTALVQRRNPSAVVVLSAVSQPGRGSTEIDELAFRLHQSLQSALSLSE
jgi:EpsI family protein